MTNKCDELRISLGGYVLDALEPNERTEVESHLATCARCQYELSTLEVLPSLLGQLTSDDVNSLEIFEPPKAIFQQALATIKASRRRRRRSALAAGIIALAAAVTGLIAIEHVQSRPIGKPSGTSAIAPISISSSSNGIRATAQLHPEPWGTSISLSLSGVSPNQRCLLLVIDKSGQQEIAGEWRASYSGQANIDGSTAIQTSSLEALRVVSNNGNTLITLNPLQG